MRIEVTGLFVIPKPIAHPTSMFAVAWVPCMDGTGEYQASWANDLIKPRPRSESWTTGEFQRG